MEQELTLSTLERGERAVISYVAGDDAVATRLGHLGFLPGTEIQTIRRAPFGDPTIYALRGNQMCLRRAETERIIISPAEVA